MITADSSLPGFWSGKRGLTTEGHEGNFGSDGAVLYYDCGDYVTFVKPHQIIHLKEVSVYFIPH